MESGRSVEAAESSGLVRGAGFVSIAPAIFTPPVGLIASIATDIWARKTNESTTLAIWGLSLPS